MSDPNTAVTVGSAAVGYLVAGFSGAAVAVIGYVLYMFVVSYIATR